MEKIVEYLKERDTVTIPDLQVKFDLTYAQAKKRLEEASNYGWISEQAVGLEYTVNKRALEYVDFSEEKRQTIVSELDEEEFELLDALVEYDPSVAMKVLRRRSWYRKALAHLKGLGLVHIVDEKFCCSMPKELLERIKKEVKENALSPALRMYIAHPLLEACAKRNADLKKIMEISFLPESCKRYILSGLEKVKRTGNLPECIPIEEEYGIYAVKADAMMAFVNNKRNFVTKRDYEKAATAECERIENMKGIHEEMKMLVRRVVDEIEMLTLEQIRSMIKE